MNTIAMSDQDTPLKFREYVYDLNNEYHALYDGFIYGRIRRTLSTDFSAIRQGENVCRGDMGMALAKIVYAEKVFSRNITSITYMP